MSTLHTEIEIGASPQRVWQILTDFPAYAEWNPFIPAIIGEARAGSRLVARLQSKPGRLVNIRPRVLVAEANRELRWRGQLGLPRLFDGEHTFRIEPLGPDRVRFVHAEHFSGLLTRPLLRMIAKDTRAGFEAMNQALKQRAESNTAAPRTEAA